MKEWVELLVTYDLIEANIVKGLLEGEGIKVIFRSSKVTPYPVNIGKMGEIKLLVRAEDLQKAKDVIKIMEDAAFREDETSSDS
ncbi:MAG: DUF2007 domain-containing protein [Nitrospirae bacterium]|nr:DUF2007 domain-containing protein [Nitrospirota bacterium]